MLRIAGLLVTALISIACASPVAFPGAAATAPASSVRMSLPSATPAEETFPSKPPSDLPSPVAAGTLTIRWRADDPSGLGEVASIVGVARTGNAFVLVADLPYRDEGLPESAAWSSTDGKAWNLAQEFPPGERIMALTAGGPGFILAGASDDRAVVWTSADGHAWKSVSDASLANGVTSEPLAPYPAQVRHGVRHGCARHGLQVRFVLEVCRFPPIIIYQSPVKRILWPASSLPSIFICIPARSSPSSS